MKKVLLKKTAALILAILTAFAATGCSGGIEEKDSLYKEKHTGENLVGTFSVSEELRLEAYYFPHEDGGAVLELKKPSSEKIIQSISLPSENSYYSSLDYDFGFSNIDFPDMNFDGYADIYLPCSVVTANLEGMAWLWDEESSSFVLSKELSELTELTVFAEEELITSQDYTDPAKILCREFKWEDGKLIQVSEYTVST